MAGTIIDGPIASTFRRFYSNHKQSDQELTQVTFKDYVLLIIITVNKKVD